MTGITRPTGEQLRFESSQTGSHVLDDYLESAEVGGRELGDLLGDIFDSNGDFVPLTHRGDYTNGAVYVKGDLVRNTVATGLSALPAFYFCTTGHTAGASMDTAKFALVAKDGAAGSQYPASDDTPLAPGTAAAGVDTEVSRSDHVHPREIDATTTVKGIVELATNAEGQTGSDTARAMTPAATKAAAIYQGTHTFWFDAATLRPRESGGPEIVSTSVETSTNKIRIDGLAYDQASIERAIARLALGKSWDEGTITVKIYWRAASGSGDVVWGVRGVAIGHDDALDAAFGTAQTTTSTLTATGDLVLSAATSAVTFAGTPAAGDMLWLEVYRVADNVSDTLNADAILIGVEITLTIDAANDA